jgi:hypothetical protein
MSVSMIFSMPFPVSGFPTGCWDTLNGEVYWGSPIENFPTFQQKFISIGLSNVTKLQCKGLNRPIRHTDALETA